MSTNTWKDVDFFGLNNIGDRECCQLPELQIFRLGHEGAGLEKKTMCCVVTSRSSLNLCRFQDQILEGTRFNGYSW